MTPSELLRIMARLGCTQAETSELVGVSDRAIRMYVVGSERSRPRSRLCCGCLLPARSAGTMFVGR